MKVLIATLLLGLWTAASLADELPPVVVHFGDVTVTSCGESWSVSTPNGEASLWLAETEDGDCGAAGLCAFTVDGDSLCLDGARLVLDLSQANMFTIYAEIVLREDVAVGGTRVLSYDEGDYSAGQPPFWEQGNAAIGEWETIGFFFPPWGTIVVAGCVTRIAEVRIHTVPSPTVESTFGAVKALYGAP